MQSFTTQTRFSIRAALLVLVSICLSSWSANALNPKKSLRHYVHAVWQIQDGLPQNSINAIVQTRDGYLWLGGLEGLVRFDGVNFTIFNSANTPGIKHNTMAALWEDDEGTLWFGTEGGGLGSYKDGEFTSVTKEQGLKDMRVNTIAQDSNGSIVAGTMSGAVYRVSKDHVVTRVDMGKTSPKREVYKVLLDTQKRLWIGAADGLFCLEQGKARRYGSTDGLPSDFIRSLYQDRDENLWVGTSEGLVRWVDGVHQVFDRDDGLGANMITSIFEDSDRNLWIGTDYGGLAVKRGDKISTYGVEDGISSEDISSFMEDIEGNLWVGTQTGGLNRFSDGSVITYTMQDGLPANATWNIIQNNDGVIWISTVGGISRYENGEFTNFRPDENTIFIAGLVQDQNGTIWLADDTRGFGTFENGKFEFIGKEDGFDGFQVRSILPDSKGRIWIGTRTDGVHLYEDGKFTHFTKADGLPGSSVRTMLETKDGLIYLGTRNGLAIYDGEKFEAIREEDGLPYNQIFSFFQDEDERIWMAFYGGGIGCLMNGKFYSARMEEGLDTSILYRVFEDDIGNMWYSTNKGISMVPKQELLDLFAGKRTSVNPRSFGLHDGMKFSECNGGSQYCGMKTLDGRVWFPTNGGYSVIDPTELVLNTNPPIVHMDRVLVDGKVVEPGVKLSPDSTRIEFHYVGLNYVAPKKVTFKYMLEGFDADWIDAKNQRTTFYTTIPPGNYVFRVKAANSEGIWNEEGATFGFVLEPKFTQTPLFWSLVALLVLLIGTAIYYIRVKSLKARQLQVTKLAWTKTKSALDGQVGAMREMTEAIAATSQKMRNMSSKLASTSTGLETAVSSTGTAIEELEATGTQSGRNAERILNASAKTMDTAKLGGDAVDQAKAIMKGALDGSIEIDDQSTNLLGRLTKVDTILSIINSIADQSRVLAINASIEAATAGEFGAGFGVVAKEMLELADQIKLQNAQVTEILIHSHTGVRDISKNADLSKAEMEKGVQSIDHSRVAVTDLTAELRSNTELANVIRKATDEQRAGLSLISNEVQSVYAAASDNTSISEQVEQEAVLLGQFVQELTEMIENWKTPEMYL